MESTIATQAGYAIHYEDHFDIKICLDRMRLNPAQAKRDKKKNKERE